MAVSRRRTSLLLGAALCAAALGLTAPPAGAVASGAFGATVVLATAPGGDIYHTETATLADGTTAVLWAPDASHLSARIRPRGTNTFGPVMTYAAGPGESVIASGVLASRYVSFTAAGPAAFLAAWSESGPGAGVRVASIPAGATYFPTPTKVSGSDVTPVGASVTAAPDGSAAVLYFAAPVGNPLVRVARRGPTGTWSAPTTIGYSTYGIEGRVGIDVAGNLTAAWLTTLPGGAFVIKLRSQVARAWTPTIIASELVPGSFTGAPTIDVAAGGGTTTVAVATTMGGNTGSTPLPFPVGIQVLQRSTPTSPWTNGPLLTGPGRSAAQPHVVASPDGSTAVVYNDYVDAIGPPGLTVASTRLAERRGPTGAWSRARTVDAVSTTLWGTHAQGSWNVSLAPDGALAIVTMATVNTGGGSMANSYSVLSRPTWGAPLSERLSPGMDGVGDPGTSLVVAPSGRITVASYNLPAGSTVEVRSTALPRPTALVAARLSTTAPRAGRALGCTATWADATTTSFRWLRNGAVISGATAATYRPRAADRTRLLACRATAGNPAGSTVSTSVARKVR